MTGGSESRKGGWIMKKLLVWPVILIAGLMTIGSGNLVFAQQNSIKLFDATSTFATGPRTSPAEAIPFVPSRSLMIDFAAGDTAMISSTPDGNGPFVVDNFL